jgi:hypothetical protein
MPNVDLSEILRILTAVGVAIVAYQLFRNGLSRQYPTFFWYFVFQFLDSLWTFFVPNNTNLYEHIWILTEPIGWIFDVLVVVELCQLVLKGHRGIYSLLRWAMYGSVAIAVTISVLSLLPKIKPRMSGDTRLLGFWFAAERGLDFALAIFLLLILIFLSRYPMRLKRNILVHVALYTIYFFGGAFSIFLRTFLGSPSTHTINMILESIGLACILGWVFFLTPKGEEVKTSFPTLNPRHEEAALRQLESLNATLLKVSGK